MTTPPRIVIAGGPRVGKTTLGQQLQQAFGLELKIFTGDDTKEMEWSDASAEVATWLDRAPGWVLEGVVSGRALRKWMEARTASGDVTSRPCDYAVFLDDAFVPLAKGQETMRKGCVTVWGKIRDEMIARGVRVIDVELAGAQKAGTIAQVVCAVIREVETNSANGVISEAEAEINPPPADWLAPGTTEKAVDYTITIETRSYPASGVSVVETDGGLWIGPTDSQEVGTPGLVFHHEDIGAGDGRYHVTTGSDEACACGMPHGGDRRGVPASDARFGFKPPEIFCDVARRALQASEPKCGKARGVILHRAPGAVAYMDGIHTPEDAVDGVPAFDYSAPDGSRRKQLEAVETAFFARQLIEPCNVPGCRGERKHQGDHDIRPTDRSNLSPAQCCDHDHDHDHDGNCDRHPPIFNKLMRERGAKLVAKPSRVDEHALAFFDVVFDGPPSHEAGRFVEVENSRGESIRMGEWVKREDGMWALRITSNGTLAPGRLMDRLRAIALEERVSGPAEAERNESSVESVVMDASEWISRAPGSDPGGFGDVVAMADTFAAALVKLAGDFPPPRPKSYAEEVFAGAPVPLAEAVVAAVDANAAAEQPVSRLIIDCDDSCGPKLCRVIGCDAPVRFAVSDGADRDEEADPVFVCVGHLTNAGATRDLAVNESDARWIVRLVPEIVPVPA